MRRIALVLAAVAATAVLAACSASDDGAFVRDIDGAGTPLPWTRTQEPTDSS